MPYPLETQNYLASIFAQLGMNPATTLPDLEPSLDAEPDAIEAEPVDTQPPDPSPDKAPLEKPAKP
jgi:hypothetical protein